MGKTTAASYAWEIRSFDDVKHLWSGVRSVPMRGEGRQHFHEERFYLGLYLLALGTQRLLRYPFQVEQGESPDFTVCWPSGEVTGLEVTRLATQEAERAMTEDQREFLRREDTARALGENPEPVVRMPCPGNWVRDAPEVEWRARFKERVKKKLEKLPRFRPASRYDLVIWDNLVLPADRRKAMAAPDLRRWLRGLEACAHKLGTISVIISLDVLFDLGGEARVLPYVDWNAPPLGRDDELREFSDRVEYAGWYATELALQHHVKEHTPVYSMDSRGRIVKHAAGGQRFEVRVGEDGSEVVLRKLSRG